MQRISKKIKNCEACLSEDTLCVPQRVLQQRKKNVVEAGEESRVRRGHPGPLNTDMRSISKKQSTGTACATLGRDRDRNRDRNRDGDRDRGRVGIVHVK